MDFHFKLNKCIVTVRPSIGSQVHALYVSVGLTVPNLDETLVEASILLVRHPHRLLGVVGLQGILLLHLEGDEEERSGICIKMENSMVFNENNLVISLPGSGSLRPPVLTWPGMMELGWSHWLGRT